MRTALAFLMAVPLAFYSTASAATISIDGSSTVYPISAAIAQRWQAEGRRTHVDVIFSGSSAGIRRLIAGEIDIANSSRPIKDSELEEAASRGIHIIELPIAIDGLTVVVNRRNTFIDHLTVEELQQMWKPDSSVKTWADVRRGWPAEPIHFTAPGKDSGTFEYFTHAIVGTTKAQRIDAFTSEDDHALVQKVASNPYAISYFGWAYFLENQAMLRAIPIAQGKGAAISPSESTIIDGSYAPLSRPIFIYVNKERLDRPDLADFLRYYLAQLVNVVPDVGYVHFGSEAQRLVETRLANRSTGSIFNGSGTGQSDIARVLREDTAANAAPAKTAPVPTMTSAPVVRDAAAVERMRAATLQLARLTLTDDSTLGEIARLAEEVATQARGLAAAAAPTTAIKSMVSP